MHSMNRHRTLAEQDTTVYELLYRNRRGHFFLDHTISQMHYFFLAIFCFIFDINKHIQSKSMFGICHLILWLLLSVVNCYVLGSRFLPRPQCLELMILMVYEPDKYDYCEP